MKKYLLVILSAALLLTATACHTPEAREYFKDAMEEDPDIELPKSDVMEIDPEDIPQYEINDPVGGYDVEETFVLPATDEYAEGELVVKYKIYDYKKENIAIVSVENHSEQPLNITVKGICCDILMQPLATITKDFDGFAAGWQNYFIFAPGEEFEEFTYEIDTVLCHEETYGQYVQDLEWNGLCLSPTHSDCQDLGPGAAWYDDWVVDIAATWSFNCISKERIYYGADFVVFDATDPDRIIYFLDTKLQEDSFKPIDRSNPLSGDHNSFFRPIYTDTETLWENLSGRGMSYYLDLEDSDYAVPEELEGASGIVAFKHLSNRMSY